MCSITEAQKIGEIHCQRPKCRDFFVGTNTSIRATKRSMNILIKEHTSDCTVGYTEKSAVAEYALTQDDHKKGPMAHKSWRHPQVIFQEYSERFYASNTEN